MFFYLSKIGPMFLFPFPLFLILAALVPWRMRPGWLRRVFVLALVGVWLLSINPVAGRLLGSLEGAHTFRSVASLPKVDAVVVLSGMVNPLARRGDRPEFTGAVDRLLVGLEVVGAGKSPRLILSGGSGLILQRGDSEAALLGAWLRRTRSMRPGVQVIVESRSRNTAENAIATARILKARGWRRVALITSAFHMRRSVLCFGKAGIQVIPVPVDYRTFTVSPGPEGWVPTSSALTMSTTALKEYLGIVAYRLRGYL